MATLAPLLEAFFTDHLMTQRQASPNTIAAYRDTFRLLLVFTRDRTGKPPNAVDIADWDVPLISAFLQHLEADRANSVTTRNARLAAIHSLFAFAALRLPEHAWLIQRVLAMPPKRYDHTGVCFLTAEETGALLAAPDRSTWTGRRDHALLQLAVQTGLRVSELIALRCQDAHLGAGPHVRCYGKGRKHRTTPLTATTVAALRIWLSERAGIDTDPIFCTDPAGHSAATPSNTWSPNTRPPPHAPAPHCRRNTSPRTSYGTPPPWRCCTPVSTCP